MQQTISCKLASFLGKLLANPQRFYLLVPHHHDFLEGEAHCQERFSVGHAAQRTLFDNIHLKAT